MSQLKSLRVIGLDISTKTGLCILKFPPGDGSPQLEALRTIKVQGGNGIRRGGALAAEVGRELGKIDCFDSSCLAFAVVEAPAFGATGKAHSLLHELSAIVRYQLDVIGVSSVIVPPNTLKKFATGHGNAKKDAMIAAAALELPPMAGSPEVDDNMADAFWLAKFGGQIVDANPAPTVAAWRKKNLDQLVAARLVQ